MDKLMTMLNILSAGSDPSRIFGEDPGRFNAETIMNLPMYELYLKIDDHVVMLDGIFNGKYDGLCVRDEYKITDEEIHDLCYEIEFLIYVACKKNDIRVEDTAPGKHIDFDSDMYLRWCRFYSYHFDHVLTDAEWQIFEWKRRNREDISNYLPKGNWRRHIA